MEREREKRIVEMETSINSYILRIYRIDRKKPQSLVGLIEKVGGKEKKPFTNFHELWEILSSPKRRRSAGKDLQRKEGNKQKKIS